MKKVLARILILAGTMIFVCAPVFASEMPFTASSPAGVAIDLQGIPEDETPSDSQKLLEATGLITGYEDGSFKKENPVNRAELATVLVKAMGYEGTGTGVSRFSDTTGHWAEGSIAQADAMGLIAGYEDGTFRGNNPVTFIDASAMVLRAAGYTNEVINDGKDVYDPSAIFNKTKELGLAADVVADLDVAKAQTLQVNRDKMFVLVVDGLTIPTVGDLANNGEPLLCKVATSDVITVTKDVLENKENSVDLSDYVFQTLSVYTTDGKVIYVDKSNSEVLPITEGSETLVNGKKTNLRTAKGALAWGNIGKTPIYFNGEFSTCVEVEIAQLANADVFNAVYTDGKLVGIVAEKREPAKLVTGVYLSGKVSFMGYSLPKTTDGKADFSRITVTGAVQTLADIEKIDVIEAVRTTDRGPIKFIVTRKFVEGRISRVAGEGASAEYYIGAESYKTGETYEDLSGLKLDAEGKFFFNSADEIVAFKPKDPAKKDNYGVILGWDKDGGINPSLSISKYPKLRMMDEDGAIADYDIAVSVAEDGSAVTGSGIKAIGKGDGPIVAELDTALDFKSLWDASQVVVKYTLDASGRIATLAPMEVTKITVNPGGVGFFEKESNKKTGSFFNYYSANKTFEKMQLWDMRDDIAKDLLVVLEPTETRFVGGLSVWPMAFAKDALPEEEGEWQFAFMKLAAGSSGAYELQVLEAGGSGRETKAYTLASGVSLGDIGIGDYNYVVAFKLNENGEITEAMPFRNFVNGISYTNVAVASVSEDGASVTAHYVLENMLLDDNCVFVKKITENSTISYGLGELTDLKNSAVEYPANATQRVDLYIVDGVLKCAIINTTVIDPPPIDEGTTAAETIVYGILKRVSEEPEEYAVINYANPGGYPVSTALAASADMPAVKVTLVGETATALTSFATWHNGAPSSPTATNIMVGGTSYDFAADATAFVKAYGTGGSVYTLVQISDLEAAIAGIGSYVWSEAYMDNGKIAVLILTEID